MAQDNPFADLIPGKPIVTKRATPAQELAAPTARAELDTKNVQLARDRLKLQAEQDAADAAKIHPSGDKHGDDYLASLPGGRDGPLASQIRGFAIGNLTFGPRPFSNPQSAAMLQHVVNFDPSFDMTDYTARSKANAAFRTGDFGKNIVALNTGLEHAQTVKGDIDALGNGNGLAGLFNPIVNAYRSTSFADDSRPADLSNDMRAFGGEADKVFAGGNGGTEGGRSAWEGSIPLNAGPNTQNSILRHDAGLFKSRLDALEYQAKQALGPNAKATDFLSPDAKKAYEALIAGGAAAASGADPNAPIVAGHPTLPPGAPPPAGGPSGGGPPPNPLHPDYGGMADLNPAGAGSVAQGATRSEHNAMAEAVINRMLRAGSSAAEINAELVGRGTQGNVSQADVDAAQAYLKKHPGYKGGLAQSLQEVPQTVFQRASGSPVAAFTAGATNAATAGYMDEIGAGVASVFGADYQKTRDSLDTNKKALADVHPVYNFLGNVAGAYGGSEIAGAALGGTKAAAVTAGALGKSAPLVGDAAYGALYGSGENNEDRLGGAYKGAVVGALGGAAARKAIGALGSAVAPTGGKMAPLYEQGSFPTLGQRVAEKGWVGRGINTAEQALQSVPGLGSLVARARNIPRDQFQIGAFNDALSDIGETLPAGTKPGTEPHVFAAEKFDKAYDDARSGMQFAPDLQFVADTNAFHASLDSGALTDASADQIKKVIGTTVASRMDPSGAMSGEAYKAASSDLSRVARDWGKNPATAQQAHALEDFITTFDNAARRNSSPEAVAKLDAADKGYAKLVRIQDAAAARGGEPGTFSPTQFDRSVQRNSGGVRSAAYNKGDALMQDYGTAGKGLVDTLPNSGTADRLLTGQAATGIAGGGGAALGLPVAALAKGAPVFAPYLPGLNYAVTRALAPNSARPIPQALGKAADTLGDQIKQRAALGGKVAVPGLLAWQGQQ